MYAMLSWETRKDIRGKERARGERGEKRGNDKVGSSDRRSPI